MKHSHPHANDHRTSKALADQTAGLDLFATREPEAPTISEAEQREIAHAAQKSKHPELIAKLRIAARNAYARLERPISTNDLREVFEQEGAGVDRRVLAVAFAESYWTPFGETQTNCSNATVERVGITRSTIRTYVPKHLLAMWEEKLKSDERRTA